MGEANTKQKNMKVKERHEIPLPTLRRATKLKVCPNAAAHTQFTEDVEKAVCVHLVGVDLD